MIVSYSRRFIFIKTRKVAGTSVELFLSPYCGPEDIVTPVSAADEVQRKGLPPRNHRLPGCGRGRLRRIVGEMLGRPTIGHGGFYNHVPAKEVRRLIGQETWDNSFKFSIERNPWERQVSLYHWQYRDRTRKPSFDRYMKSRLLRKVSKNFDTYAIDGKIAVDHVCRYENLADELRYVMDRIGLEGEVSLPQSKSGYRSGKPHWRDYYTPETRDIVARLYAREIEAFGYEF